MVNGSSATISGGKNNNSSGSFTSITGGLGNWVNGGFYSMCLNGRNNSVGGDFTAILEGDGCTINQTSHHSIIFSGTSNAILNAEFSVLFGIADTLTQDSTFMIDMPHIHFGDEVAGYELPTVDGSAGQVLTTDSDGQASWSNPAGGGGAGVVPIGAIVAWNKSLAGLKFPRFSGHIEKRVFH